MHMTLSWTVQQISEAQHSSLGRHPSSSAFAFYRYLLLVLISLCLLFWTSAEVGQSSMSQLLGDIQPRVTCVTTLTGYRNYREIIQILVPDFIAFLCYPAKVVKGIVRLLTCITFYLPSLYRFFLYCLLFFLFSYFLIQFYLVFLLFVLQFRFIPFISLFLYKSPCNLPTKNKSVSGLHCSQVLD